jgi:hypothetical protein
MVAVHAHELRFCNIYSCDPDMQYSSWHCLRTEGADFAAPLADGSCSDPAVQAYIRLLAGELVSQGVKPQSSRITCAPQPVVGRRLSQSTSPSKLEVKLCTGVIYVDIPSNHPVVTVERLGNQCQVRSPAG